MASVGLNLCWVQSLRECGKLKPPDPLTARTSIPSSRSSPWDGMINLSGAAMNMTSSSPAAAPELLDEEDDDDDDFPVKSWE